MRISAKKSLGQNFLVNKGILAKIVDALELSGEDTVLEIGPGTGALTELLAQKARRVIAVEKDHRLIANLRERFTNVANQNSNVEIIEGDILKFNPSSYTLVASGYKVVGNIPYYITSHLLKIIFERWPKPQLVVLTVQKEVAQRIMAPSTSSGQAKPLHTNLLALSVQYYAEPKIISYVSKGSFRPIPKVDSAIIKLVPRTPDLELSKNSRQLFRLIHIGFAGKRKQLMPQLLKKTKMKLEDMTAIFDKIGIHKKARAENLSLGEWINLNSKLTLYEGDLF